MFHFASTSSKANAVVATLVPSFLHGLTHHRTRLPHLHEVITEPILKHMAGSAALPQFPMRGHTTHKSIAKHAGFAKAHESRKLLKAKTRQENDSVRYGYTEPAVLCKFGSHGAHPNRPRHCIFLLANTTGPFSSQEASNLTRLKYCPVADPQSFSFGYHRTLFSNPSAHFGLLACARSTLHTLGSDFKAIWHQLIYFWRFDLIFLLGCATQTLP